MLLLSFQLADDQDVVDLSHYSFIFDKNSTEVRNISLSERAVCFRMKFARFPFWIHGMRVLESIFKTHRR